FVTESIRIKTPNALRGGGTVARGHALGRRTSLDTATDSTPERAGPGSGHARHAATCPAAPAGNPLIPVRSPPPARGRSCRIAVDVREESAGACGTGRRVPQYERVDNVRLLVVDDDPPIADLVATVARYEGWQAVTANSGAQALRRAARFRPDIVVLDLMLPDVDGFGVLDRLRRAGTMVPVVFLTARDGVADRVEGLTRGGDDYLVKPFAVEELMARLRTVLRRSGGPAPRPPVLRVADLTMDEDTREVRRGERLLSLT